MTGWRWGVGGYGSGRHAGRQARPLMEHSLELPLASLRKAGALAPGQLFASTPHWSLRGERIGSIQWVADMRSARSLNLSYRWSPDGAPPMQVEERFSLVTTSPHLGGVRWWILCRCGRRATSLC